METFKKRQKESGGWNASGIRPPNAWKSRLARLPASQTGQTPIAQRSKTPWNPAARWIRQRGFEAIHYVREPKFRGDPAPRF